MIVCCEMGIEIFALRYAYLPSECRKQNTPDRDCVGKKDHNIKVILSPKHFIIRFLIG